jgi:hypothetical protein
MRGCQKIASSTVLLVIAAFQPRDSRAGSMTRINVSHGPRARASTPIFFDAPLPTVGRVASPASDSTRLTACIGERDHAQVLQSSTHGAVWVCLERTGFFRYVKSV